MAREQAAIAKVRDLPIHYTVQGTGHTIIFVHGWTCDETSWAKQVPAFTGKYRVVTLDLPGHGRSGTPQRQEFSMSLFVDAVEAVRAATSADRIVLVGHSMGAVVIRQYGLTFPERVAGLVAVDGPLDVRPIAGLIHGQPPMTYEARKQLVSGMFVPETPGILRKRITTMMLNTSEETAAGSGSLMFDRANLSDKVTDVPALTIYAGKPLFPIDPNTTQYFPNWQPTQIGGSGHFVMLEKPRKFNRLLASFLLERAQY